MSGANPSNDKKREAAKKELRKLVLKGISPGLLDECHALADRTDRLLQQLPGVPRATVLHALFTKIIEQERQAKLSPNELLLAAGEFIGLRDESAADPPLKTYEPATDYEMRLLRGGRHLVVRRKPIETSRNIRAKVDDACNELLIAIDNALVNDREINELAGDIRQSRNAGEVVEAGAASELLAPSGHETEILSSDPQSDARSSQPAASSRRVLRVIAVAVVSLSAITLVIFYSHRQGNMASPSGVLRNGWPAATCGDIGNNQPHRADPLWGDLFREAYNRAGGERELGCPRTDDPSGYVHPWAKGISQDLRGGKVGKARIMTLNDPKHVLVMAGSYYEDYTTPYGDNAAQTMGYPVSDPISCGPGTTIVLLDGAESAQGAGSTAQTPGAMVTNPVTGRLVWVPRVIWERYERLGGPLGRLGRPLTNFKQAPSGAIQNFEHGYIRNADGTAKTDLEDLGKQEPPPLGNLGSCLNQK